MGSSLLILPQNFTEPIDCAYNYNTVRHETEYCINLKHKIHELIEKNVVKIVVPNANRNPLTNYAGPTINMIDTEEELCMVKAVVLASTNYLEKVIASPSII